MTNLIAQAVAGFKAAAMDRSEARFLSYVARVEEKLVEHNGDINAFAPRAKTGFGRAAYMEAQGKRNGVESITNRTGGNQYGHHHVNAPDVRAICPVKVARGVEAARAAGAASFEAWVAKLIGKIGDVTSATIDAANVWDGATLTVTTVAGEVQNWKTTMIVNCSVLGTLFNQWPTRQVKAKARKARA